MKKGLPCHSLEYATYPEIKAAWTLVALMLSVLTGQFLEDMLMIQP